MTKDEVISRYSQHVGYTSSETEKLCEGESRVRHLPNVAKAAPLFSIEAEVV